jgi:sialate O-acetylesterase
LQAASPVASSVKVDQFAIVVKFKELQGGLMVKNRPANDSRYNILVEGFTVQDTVGDWHFAFGVLSPDKQELAILTPDGVDKVTKIRYAWASNPERANLYSKEGLPVTPFELKVE